MGDFARDCTLFVASGPRKQQRWWVMALSTAFRILSLVTPSIAGLLVLTMTCWLIVEYFGVKLGEEFFSFGWLLL